LYDFLFDFEDLVLVLVLVLTSSGYSALLSAVKYLKDDYHGHTDSY